MSDTQQSTAGTPQQASAGNEQAYDVVQRVQPPTAWVGVVLFGGIVLLMVGAFQVMQGFLALLKDEFYLAGPEGLLLSVDFTTWGWIHLLIGSVAVVTAFGVMVGQMWARVLGIVIAGVSALANVAFLSAYPILSTLIIAMDLLVIYAFAVHGGEAGKA